MVSIQKAKINYPKKIQKFKIFNPKKYKQILKNMKTMNRLKATYINKLL